MERKRKILSILECQANEEYWTELDFEDMGLEEIEQQIGRFILQTLLTIKGAGTEKPCMHLSAAAITEEQYQEMRNPGASEDDFAAQLEELMSDVESGRSTGDDS